MAYQAHDPLGMDEDNQNYHRGGDDNPLEYHKREGSDDLYSSEPGDLYASSEPNEDLQQHEDSDTIEESLGFSEEDEQKYESDNTADEGVVKKAADEVFQEGQQPVSRDEEKKSKKSIEDAINRAIKEEKEVLHLD